MISRYPSIKRLRPIQHDWNDQLRLLPITFWSLQNLDHSQHQISTWKEKREKPISVPPFLIISPRQINIIPFIKFMAILK
jgi:hypothetical protein